MYRLRGRTTQGFPISGTNLPYDDPREALAFVHEQLGNLELAEGDSIEVLRIVRVDQKKAPTIRLGQEALKPRKLSGAAAKAAGAGGGKKKK